MTVPTVAYVTADRVLGVDLWRVFDPARELDRMGHPVAVVPLGTDVPLLDGRPPEVLVCSQRASRALGAYAAIRDRLCRPNRMLLVLDACDDPVTKTGFVGERRRAVRGDSGWTAGELHRDAIRSADLVTVPTEAMARVVRPLNRRVEVVPDLIEGSRWVPPSYVRPVRMLGDPLVIGAAGGESHDEDWRVLSEAWPRVAERYPGVRFVTIGHRPEHLDRAMGDLLVTIPWQPIDRYHHAYAALDVGCAPLDADLPFNRSKSPIKWYEYTLAGAATVASPTVYGRVIDAGKTGLLATSAGEWVVAIEALLDSRRRERMVEAARRVVIDRYALGPERMRETLAIYERHHRRVYGADDAGRRAARVA